MCATVDGEATAWLFETVDGATFAWRKLPALAGGGE